MDARASRGGGGWGKCWVHYIHGKAKVEGKFPLLSRRCQCKQGFHYYYGGARAEERPIILMGMPEQAGVFHFSHRGARTSRFSVDFRAIGLVHYSLGCARLKELSIMIMLVKAGSIIFSCG